MLDGLLEALGQRRWGVDPGDLLDVGDFDIRYAIAVDGEAYRVDKIERGGRRTLGRFSDRDAAYRYLVLTLAESLRDHRGWPPIRHRRLAPRAELTDAANGRRLTWPDGWAEFRPGWLGELHALPYSWAAQLAPQEIAESYGHRNGEPGFDLGVEEHEPEATPPVSTLKPRPVEVPPPDPAADRETDAVLAAAAEIDWTRQPLSAGDVLVVGQDDVGRVIGFRLGVFEYSSYAGSYRRIVGTFSTAAAARRFLAVEAATLARQRRRQPTLRVARAKAGFTVSKGPTELTVDGGEVRATFPLGPVGQQHALTFTYAADAALADIATSYTNPAGAPLFAST